MRNVPSRKEYKMLDPFRTCFSLVVSSKGIEKGQRKRKMNIRNQLV
jgi:hypothetical protein